VVRDTRRQKKRTINYRGGKGELSRKRKGKALRSKGSEGGGQPRKKKSFVAGTEKKKKKRKCPSRLKKDRAVSRGGREALFNLQKFHDAF